MFDSMCGTGGLNGQYGPRDDEGAAGPQCSSSSQTYNDTVTDQDCTKYEALEPTQQTE